MRADDRERVLITARNLRAIAALLDQAERMGEPGVIRISAPDAATLRRDANLLADVAREPTGTLRERVARALAPYGAEADADTFVAQAGLEG